MATNADIPALMAHLAKALVEKADEVEAEARPAPRPPRKRASGGKA